MRFIVDECTGTKVAQWLKDNNHQVFSIYDQARGMKDDSVLEKAFNEDWILITNDKDFGEMIFKNKKPHKGIILLRLEDERSSAKIEVIKKLLTSFYENFSKCFIVATEKQVRIIHS